jgi:hypothetical protein
VGAAPARWAPGHAGAQTSTAWRLSSCPSTSATCSSGTPAADISEADEWRVEVAESLQPERRKAAVCHGATRPAGTRP